MFSFLNEIAGAPPDTKNENSKAGKEAQSDEHAAQPDSAASVGLGLGSLWSVATAVTSAVKHSADEVVKSVAHTDWKSELAAFTQEVEAEAHKAVEVVQHLPQHIVHTHEQQQQQQQGTRLSRISEGSSTPRADGNGGGCGSAAAGGGAPLASVGVSLVEFGKQLISGTKEVIDTVTEMVEGEIATATKEVPRFAAGGAAARAGGNSSSSSAAARIASRRGAAARYSRFEAEVAAMQRDSSTYCDEPEDAADYAAWRSSSASMQQRQPEIDKIMAGNAFMAELQSRIVPLLVEKEDFWARYFYRLHKLQQKEEQRQQLAARAKQQQHEAEELGGWDDEDPQSPRTRAAQQQQQQQQQQHEQQQVQQEEAVEQQVQQQQQTQRQAAADEAGPDEAAASASSAAAPAAAAAAADDEDDEDWGEDADQVAPAAAAAGAAGSAKAAGAAAGGKEDEDWGDWD
ncbi:hypothetical protein OEZ86_005761 [Tetradesmus obliquus]|nr:hypothetical protein OEZ86_005761 [Tetradesmus obliquus]